MISNLKLALELVSGTMLYMINPKLSHGRTTRMGKLTGRNF